MADTSECEVVNICPRVNSGTECRVTPPAFGADIRREEFRLNDDVTYLNHGSFGVVPRRVHEKHMELLSELEAEPDLFIRRTKAINWEQSISLVAEFVGSDVKNLTFVQNATSGIANILRSVPFRAGDIIVYNNFTYGAIANSVEVIVDATPGVQSVIIEHSIPITSSDVIVQQYEDTLDANPNVKLALIDHIATVGLQLPIERIVDVCRSRGVLALVDGAHCPGQIHLNIEQMAPDFYVGNLHKWVFTPRGCAIQWVAPQHHDIMKPAVTSFDNKEPYPTPFFQQGTRDDTAYFCTDAAIEFLKWIGDIDAIQSYADELWVEGEKLLTEAWGTEVIQIPPDMVPPYMHVVRLPDMERYPTSRESLKKILDELYDGYKIWCPAVIASDVMYLRISIYVYVTLGDFEKLRDAVLDMMAKQTT